MTKKMSEFEKAFEEKFGVPHKGSITYNFTLWAYNYALDLALKACIEVNYGKTSDYREAITKLKEDSR